MKYLDQTIDSSQFNEFVASIFVFDAARLPKHGDATIA